jgi:hypothetical protein
MQKKTAKKPKRPRKPNNPNQPQPMNLDGKGKRLFDPT